MISPSAPSRLPARELLASLTAQARQVEIDNYLRHCDSDGPGAIVTAYDFGMKYSPVHLRSSAPQTRGIRGSVIGFSENSRRRLQGKLLAIDWRDAQGVGQRSEKSAIQFLTLTYPASYPDSWLDWKNHLQRFKKRLIRRYGEFGAIWRLEFQKRGAPHFHIVIFFDSPRSVSRLTDWARGAWSGCGADDGSSGDWHKLMGAKSVPCYMVNDDPTRLMSYLSKYLSKLGSSPLDEDDRPTGRCWGTWYPDNIPTCDATTIYLVGGRAVAHFINLAHTLRPNSPFVTSRTPDHHFTLYGFGWPPDVHLYQLDDIHIPLWSN